MVNEMSYEQAKKIVEAERARREDAEAEENLQKSKALVGKCFKYRNSYGDSHDRWWLYLKVVDVQKGWRYYGDAVVDEFEYTSLDRTEIKRCTHPLYNGEIGPGYIPIPESEFNRGAKAVLNRMGLKRAK